MAVPAQNPSTGTTPARHTVQDLSNLSWITFSARLLIAPAACAVSSLGLLGEKARISRKDLEPFGGIVSYG
jgi:hypothetical protein